MQEEGSILSLAGVERWNVTGTQRFTENEIRVEHCQKLYADCIDMNLHNAE